MATKFVGACAFTCVDAAAREAEAPMGNDANDVDADFYIKEKWQSLHDIILREADRKYTSIDAALNKSSSFLISFT